MSRRGRIARDRAVSVERWNPAVLQSGTAAAARPAEPDPLEVAAAQAEALREAARAEGHAEGLAAGREQAAREIARLRELAGTLGEAVEGFQQALAVEVMDLAVAVARQVLREAVAVDPAVVLPVIREAVASLPHGHPALRLHVNPVVAATVGEALGEAPGEAPGDARLPGNWQVVADATIEPGGCRIETASGEIDATMPARWRAVVAALGSTARWVETGERASDAVADSDGSGPGGRS
jgi:flagellar assembly protein FliH